MAATTGRLRMTTPPGSTAETPWRPGPPHWSMHAYGLAIDVDTVENPYIQPGQPIDPPSSAAYANRSDIRPGMAYPGGVLVSAFSFIGWGWGGNWTGSPDYQHFSSNGH